MKLNKTDELVVAALQPMGTECTLAELTEKSELPSKKIFKSLRKLFENELIDSKARKYKLLVAPEDIKAKLAKKTKEAKTK